MSNYFNKTIFAHIIAQLLDKLDELNTMDRMDSQKYAKIAIILQVILSQTAFQRLLLL